MDDYQNSSSCLSICALSIIVGLPKHKLSHPTCRLDLYSKSEYRDMMMLAVQCINHRLCRKCAAWCCKACPFLAITTQLRECAVAAAACTWLQFALVPRMAFFSFNFFFFFHFVALFHNCMSWLGDDSCVCVCLCDKTALMRSKTAPLVVKLPNRVAFEIIRLGHSCDRACKPAALLPEFGFSVS